MAIAYVAASAGGGSTASSLTVAHNVGAGENRILFVGYGGAAAGAVTGITYAGQAMTRVGSELNGAAGVVGMFYIINPTANSNNWVISLSSSQYIYGAGTSYTGADQVSQPDSSNTRSASTTTSGNISTTIVANNSWTVCFANAASSAISGGVNATIRANPVNNERAILDSNGTLASGSQTMNFTSAGNANWSEIIASFDPYIPPSSGSPIFFGNTAIA